MESDDAEDEDDGENEDDDGIDLEAGRLIRVKPYATQPSQSDPHTSNPSPVRPPRGGARIREKGEEQKGKRKRRKKEPTQHRARAPSSARGARAARPRARELVLLVGSSAAADDGARPAGRQGRRRPPDAGARCDAAGLLAAGGDLGG